MKHPLGHNALRTSARLTLAAIAVTSFSLPAFANDEENLETMTVTTNRMPSENLLAPTTVITRADIERLQINDLPTLLSRQPGIDMSVNGGMGKTSSIFMRGSNSGHVLVLVDGVKWHSATLGTPSIQHFPVEQIERIEIVRGPRSGLYGSEAIGGVIQIFTRQGQQGVNPYAKVSYGTHDTRQAAVGVSGGNEQTTYNLSLNHQNTRGIDARDGLSDDDRDAYRNNSVSAKLQHQVNDALDVGMNFIRTEGSSEFDGYYYKGHTVEQILGVNSSYEVNDSWAINAQLSESRDESKSYNNSGSDHYDTRHRFATISNIIDLSEAQKLNIGFDYDLDDIDSSKDHAEDSRYNRALFFGWQGSINKHSWLLSGRHDDNEAFGSHNTGIAEWGYWLQDSLQFTASAGTAFKAPTFNALYWPLSLPAFGFPGYAGNPNLKPEESKSFEIGFKGFHDWANWSINAYSTRIDDLILGAGIVGPGNIAIPQNVDKAKIKGIEFDLSTTIAGWDIAANATFLKPEDDVTGNILRRRAQRMASLNVDNQWGEWSAGASWKLSGHRYEDVDNDNRLGGYGTVDIRAAYQLDSDWSLQANVSNLFDKEYQTVDTYNSLDRIGMLSIIYQP